jgi:D-alanine-D-alanine ligase
MEVAIAYDLVTEVVQRPGTPDELLEEYDPPETIDAIEEALRANGVRTRRLGGGERLVRALLDDRPDLVFNVAEGAETRSREAHIPAVLELLGVPYTHSDPLTMAVTLDKAAAKVIVAAQGLPTPAHQLVDDPDFDLELELPLVAKPAHEGSSIGIYSGVSIIREASDVRPRVRELLDRYRQPVLLEEMCPGEELTVGVLGSGEGAEAVGVMEIVPRNGDLGDFLYSLDVKRNYEAEVEYRVPPSTPPETARRAQEIALEAYRALGCRDVARIDLRVGRDGRPQFLEANPLPGLHPKSSDLVILTGMLEMPYAELIGRILDEARRRYGL